MRILTNKKKEEILKKVAACHLIAMDRVDDEQTSFELGDILADIAIAVGGISVCDDFVSKYFDPLLDEQLLKETGLKALNKN